MRALLQIGHDMGMGGFRRGPPHPEPRHQFVPACAQDRVTRPIDPLRDALAGHTPDHDYSLLCSPCGCTSLLVGCCRTTWASCTSCSTTVRACTRVAAFFHLFLNHETHSAILCAVYEDHAIFTDKSKFEEAHSRGQGLNKSKLQLAHELLAMVYRYSRNAAVSTIVQAKHDAASE